MALSARGTVTHGHMVSHTETQTQRADTKRDNHAWWKVSATRTQLLTGHSHIPATLDTGLSPQGYNHREMHSNRDTASPTQEHSPVHKDSLIPKDAAYVPHRAGARPLGEATSRPGLVRSIQEPLACRLQVGLDVLAWWSLQSLHTGEQP